MDWDWAWDLGGWGAEVGQTHQAKLFSIKKNYLFCLAGYFALSLSFLLSFFLCTFTSHHLSFFFVHTITLLPPSSIIHHLSYPLSNQKPLFPSLFSIESTTDICLYPENNIVH